MTWTGKVSKGAIILPPEIRLPDGTEVEVRPAKKRKPAAKGSKPRVKPRPRSLAERLANVMGKATGLPADASVNHDHYLYGLPGSVLILR